MGTINLNKKLWQWLTLILLAVIWGTSFILMKEGLNSYTPLQVASLRMFIAFLFFTPFAWKAIKKIRKNHLPYLIFISLVGNGLTAFLFALAQTEIKSSMAGMLNATTPLFTFIIGVIFYSLKTKLYKIIGLLIALVGTISLLYFDSDITLSSSLLFPLLVIIATIFYSVNVNMVKFNLKDLDGLTISILTFVFIGPVSLIVFLFTDYSSSFAKPDLVYNTSAIVILAIMCSGIALILFNILIKYTSTIFASTVTYLIPIVAIFLGFFDGEEILFLQILSVVVIIAGIYLVNKD
jgi:drug/metabolite transporter (DMT)-like permease